MGNLYAGLDEVTFTVPTGQDRSITSTWLDEDGVAYTPGAVSLWIGGDDDDLDDTTGATEVVGVIVSNTVTFDIPATTTVSQLLRLELDGEMVGVGRLRTSKKGATTGTATFQIGTNTATVRVSGGGLGAHLTDTTDAHDASAISLADALGHFTGEEVEAALAEVGEVLEPVAYDARRAPLFIRPQDFSLGQGGPVLASIGARWHGWTLREVTSDRVNTILHMPDVDRVDIDLLWCPLTNNLGAPCMQVHLGRNNVGDNGTTPSQLFTLPVGDADGKVTPPVITGTDQTGRLRRNRIASNVDISTDDYALLMVTRIGTDPLDTLTGDMALLGLIVTPTPTENVLTDDGVWCWFNEPRLVADEATGKVFGGFVTQDGSIGIAELDTADGSTSQFILHSALEVDDHDAPGICILPDGRILAAYSRHAVANDPIYVRRSTNPNDISAWGAAAQIDLAGLSDDRPTYPKPFYLGSTLFLMFRNDAEQWITVSYDDGATWGTPFKLLTFGGSGNTGYVNILPSADGSRVDFITTDAHPTTASDVDLWHGYITDEPNFPIYKTDGIAVANLATLAFLGNVGLSQTALSQVYEASTDGDSWGWDLALDDAGRPVVAFATFPSDTAHAYHVARWDGDSWVDSTVVADAGGTFCDRLSQPHYSGGMALASADSVYVSVARNGTFEIERWDTADDGATWRRAQIVTRRSSGKQVRPTTPEFGGWDGCPPVFWMSGWYTHYIRYGMRLVYAGA